MRTFASLSTTALLGLTASLLPFPLALAKCCGGGECVSWSPFPRPNRPDAEICNRWKCEDGFHHGPFQCCGRGKCNVFCCNCDAVNGQVCRSAKESLFVEVDAEEVLDLGVADADMFRLANTAGTGHMSLEEFAAYLGAAVDDAQLVGKFELYDKNGDGFLQVEEMRLE